MLGGGDDQAVSQSPRRAHPSAAASAQPRDCGGVVELNGEFVWKSLTASPCLEDAGNMSWRLQPHEEDSAAQAQLFALLPSSSLGYEHFESVFRLHLLQNPPGW